MDLPIMDALMAATVIVFLVMFFKHSKDLDE